MFAGGLDWLFVARSIQGLATGLLLGATGAALVDLHPQRNGAQAGLVNGIASAAGIALWRAGGRASSSTYSPSPEVAQFVVIAVLAVLGAWATWRLPETVASSRQAHQPHAARPAGAAWRCGAPSASRASVSSPRGRSAGSTWSLGPAIIGQLHPTQNHAVGGLFMFVLSARARCWHSVVLRDVPEPL